MKVVILSRTSRDEASGGQHIGGQTRQLREDAAAMSAEVVAEFEDENVSGSVPPAERPDGRKAVDLVRRGQADLILCRDWTRVTRENPVRAMAGLFDLAAEGVLFHVSRDRPLPFEKPEEEWDMVEYITASVAFSDGYGYRYAVRKATQQVMDDIGAGRRKTESGKPPGRPKKVSDEKVREYYLVAVEVGSTAAARQLSEELGWKADQDKRTQKKYWIGASTLTGAFDRLKLEWPLKSGGKQ